MSSSCKISALFCGFVFLFSYIVAEATSSDIDAYNRGNALYRRGNYLAAVGEYEKVVGQGVVNGHLFYNLGNAYYKAGKLGRAILAYERASRLLPNDEDIEANLRFANAMKKDKEPQSDPNILERSLQAVYRGFSERWLAILASVSLFLLSGAGVGFMYAPTRRVLWVGLLTLWGISLGLSTSLLGAKVLAHRSNTDAIVLAEKLSGQSGPGTDFLQVFTIHEGTKVSVQRMDAEWMLIRLSNGVGGWVRRKGVEWI